MKVLVFYGLYSLTGQVFLVDYGLAYRFLTDGNHKQYKEDPKRKHDGTIEFTSLDAHKGVAPSRRTDLEILGYVMLQWLCSKLPWEDNLADKEYVMNSKIRCSLCQLNIAGSLSVILMTCFNTG